MSDTASRMHSGEHGRLTGWNAQPLFLEGGGETGSQLRTFDWSSSSLGSPADWPQTLKIVVPLMLNSRQPMFVAWGTEPAFLFNDGYRKLFGAHLFTAIGQPLRKVWPRDWDEFRTDVESAIASGNRGASELTLFTQSDDSPTDTRYHFSCSPLLDELGEVAGVICTCAIGSVSREHNLEHDAERYRALVDASAQIVWTLDAFGQVTEASPSWCAYTGQTESERQGAGWLNAIHPDDRGYAAQSCRAAIKDQVTLESEYRIRHDSGEWRWSAARGVPFADESGSVRGWVCMNLDITRRHDAETIRETLIEELNHRVRNTLTIVKSLASQTRRHTTSIEEFGEALDGRFQALGTAHTLLANSKWGGTELGELIRQQVMLYCPRSELLTTSGPSVTILPKKALALTLIIHELAANAAKFGALSSDDGHLDVTWTIDTEDAEQWITLDWRESGGPTVTAPTRSGFGTQLVDFSVAHEFQGRVERDFADDGLICTLTLQLPTGSRA